MDEEEVAVEMRVFGARLMAPIDTAAFSIWVDYSWFLGHGGRMLTLGGAATAADGREIAVKGTGEMAFSVWGENFTEKVRVITTLPTKVLIGRKFWRRNGLVLDLEQGKGSIRSRSTGERISGCLGRQSRQLGEAVCAVIEDADVDGALQGMDLSEFSPEAAKQEKLRERLWSRRAIFKGVGKIESVQHKILLKEGVEPVSVPVKRRSPKEEEIEKAAMGRLLKLGVLEPAVSPWAANNVFVRKKDHGIRVTSDFRRLNALTVTESYPMENVRETLDWLATKKVFSTFDIKDGFYNVELAPESRACTAIRTCLGLLQYTRLPMGLKNSPGMFQRILNRILGPRKGKDVMSFMDDASVGTESEDEHLVSLAAVLDAFISAGVRLKL